jgi:hypothetical protein
MDNATGYALTYEVGRLVKQLQTRKRNLVVVFFDQEETDHAGNFAFAEYCKKQNWSIHSVHTADMIGWDSDHDRNIELELPTLQLEAIYRRHAEGLGITAYTTTTSETDHREFRKAGFNAIGIGGEYKNGDTSPHHHKLTDTLETVDFKYLAFVTDLVFGVVSELIDE